MSTLARECNYKDIETPTNVNVISMSTPYMLNLHPVSSTISDAIGFEGTKFEDTDSVDGSTTDGMEHIFNSSTQLRYGRDLRLNEVSCGHIRIVQTDLGFTLYIYIIFFHSCCGLSIP